MTINVPQNTVAPQQVNTSSGLSGQAHEIVTLSDGTFVAIYDAAGSTKFQQFDQFGNKIGVEGTLATPNSAGGVQLSIVAVEDNKIVVAYETTLDFIQVQSFQIVDGVGTTTADISQQLDIDGLNPNDSPAVSGSSLADVAVHALFGAGNTRELVTFTDLDTATPQSVQFSTNFSSETDQEAILLTNGNRVVVVDTNGQGSASNNELTIHIVAPDGTEITTLTTNPANGDGIAQPQVTALTGGGFVIAVRSQDGDSDLEFQVFNADGTLVNANSQVVFTNNADENNDPEVVPLDDGGFLVFFDRDNGTSRVLGRRFDENGNPLGGAFEVDRGGAIGFPVATVLENGLVAVQYIDSGTLQVALVATEALDVVLTNADETITGTVESDIIDGAGGDDDISGGEGDDTLSGGSGTNILRGDEGADTFIGGEGIDDI